jgi:hypothetical protein
MNGPILPGECITTVRSIPNPINKDTIMTELKWVCVGYFTDRHMNDELAYLEDTKLQAEAKCRQLNPSFDIYYTKRVDD